MSSGKKLQRDLSEIINELEDPKKVNNLLKSYIESILFVSSEPLNLRKLEDITGLKRGRILEALLSLKLEYKKPQRGVMLKEINKSYKLLPKPKLTRHLEQYFEISRKIRITQSAMEILGIIAYRQPITKPEIEDLRGTDCTSQISRLIDLEFITITGTKDVPGRPRLYGTTDRFLQYFDLESLEDLPPIEELKQIFTESEDGPPIQGE